MPKPSTESLHPMLQVETAAYHAYREWPVWLVLRENELAALQPSPSQPISQPVTVSPSAPAVASQPPSVSTQKEKHP